MYSTIHKLILITTVAFPLALLLLDVDAQSMNGRQALQVTYNKTTSIVFPTSIASVDRGSRELLAQRAKGVENVLHLKASRPALQETNLTVITIDGSIHQFSVQYVKEPSSLVIRIGDTVSHTSGPVIFDAAMNEFDFAVCAADIVEAERNIRLIGKSKYKITLSLRNIFIKDDVIFFHLNMKNQSNINYDVDFLRFYIQDKAKLKRTASQEVDMLPLFTYGDNKTIRGNSQQDVVFALHKFTIPDAKYLAVEMYEQNGGRNIDLKVKNKSIIKAKLID